MAPSPHNNPFFTHIDVSAHPANASSNAEATSDLATLLKLMIHEQRRQTGLIEELIQQLSSSHRQRANELGQWKEANPYLARQCRQAAESLSNVQTEFLRHLTEEINEHAEDYMEGEFLLNEFVDRYGPRLAHLNGVLQVLAQLSSLAPTAEAAH